ncbi:DUF3306 domain-containing protein [Aestuariirhabdus sp. Z084]|uniref:DUF3306 domain-containing protein n=1 Tax=Aestuariirhabdus haliotis TaxID=2918751 RepID=UPI00201B3E87|nr:DUF3306 domain-containing protein [Aestuariirhabdus haliotis]MCL6416257.1 DUF3306 domain-containing protein [Aestuariirhabdus haliotis]MCL6420283.1 DUF3306 domain-containing protein [Aestuariirhabdus haliotis]
MTADDNDGNNEGFASRWSRLKRQSEAPTSPEPSIADQASLTQTSNKSLEQSQAATQDHDSDEAPKTDADMPELGSLGNDDSYADFLSEGVSDELRAKALKQLFHLSHFNITDKLDDYDEDFSVFEPLGDTVSEHLKRWIDRDPSNTHPKPATDQDSTIASDQADSGKSTSSTDDPETEAQSSAQAQQTPAETSETSQARNDPTESQQAKPPNDTPAQGNAAERSPRTHSDISDPEGQNNPGQT